LLAGVALASGCDQVEPPVFDGVDAGAGDVDVVSPDGVAPDADADPGEPDTATEDSDADASTGTDSDGSPGSDAPAVVCLPPGELVSGSERLVDLFVVPEGIIVVRSDALQLIGRDGVVVETVASPRVVTSAALDGDRLAITDGAKLRIFTRRLDPLAEGLLVESCVDSVVLTGGPLVCGAQSDGSNRSYFTYDLDTATLIKRSSTRVSHRQLPMRAVPGTRDFITAGKDATYSDHYLNRVRDDGEVVYINQSPFSGASGSSVFGYVGRPATHLVNWDGQLLEIAGSGCDSDHDRYSSGCFRPDGNLGTLWGGQRYASLSNDEAGSLYAVVSPDGSNYDDVCYGGCPVQQIDVAGRRLVALKNHAIQTRRIVAQRPDRACGTVVLGYELPGYPHPAVAGYRVDVLDLVPVVQPEDPPPVDPPPDAGAPEPVPTCGPAGTLLTGRTRILNAFPTGQGVLVVRSDGVLLLDRLGQTIESVATGREITAAGFDGERLAVADRAILTVYDRGLNRLRASTLRELCIFGGIAAGRFICQAGRQSNGVYWTYQLTGPSWQGPYLVSRDLIGVNPRPVAGMPYFMTGGSLFRLSDAGEVVTTVQWSGLGVVGFVGSPGTHTINEDGQMHRIFGNGCDGRPGPSPDGCFVPDGVVGTLGHNERFVTTVQDPDGERIYALVKHPDPDRPFPMEDGSYSVQQIHVPDRLILSRQPLGMTPGRLLAVDHDQACNRLILVDQKNIPITDYYQRTGDFSVYSLAY
jgi:hypothetical protein